MAITLDVELDDRGKKPSPRQLWPALGLAMLLCGAGATHAAEKRVNVIRTQDNGIQPQAIVDAKGTLHLLYFKGKPGEGDLFYVRRAAGTDRFSEPLQVNSQTGSAIALGTIRGGQIAVGKDARVHVAWNGSAAVKGSATGIPMYYTRLNDAGTAFEPQRNLMQGSYALDGGGTVTADKEGNVFVAWHALKQGGERGEENRQVWVAVSTDDGKTFAAEKQVNVQATGACGCCALRGFSDDKGTIHFLYRAATEKVHRDMYLLMSSDHGKSFRGTMVHPWEINACPMSSEAFAEGPNGVMAAWETDGQVHYTKIEKGKASNPEPAPGVGKNRKHPALALNERGEMILVWTEGTGWQKGGALVWQVFDKTGKPTEEKGRLDDGIPVWSLPTVVANPDGGFLIIH